MKRLPPHLPPPVCNIAGHKKWLRLKLIAASAAFGLLAGMSGAAVMLGWIWPGYGGGDTWAVSRRDSGLSRTQLEERARQEMADRVVEIYSRPLALGGAGYFSREDKLGEAVIISSDGWLAMYLPGYNGNYKNWRALASDGSVYKIEKVLMDRQAGVLYMKIDNNTEDGRSDLQFKVVGFSDRLAPMDEIFVYQRKGWRYGALGYPVEAAVKAAHLDTAPAVYYNLDKSFMSGSVAINNRGRVAGFVTEQNTLLPYFYLTRIMPAVLSQQKIIYPSLGVEGWFSEEQPIIIQGERMGGFAVNRVWVKNSALRKGDVILEMNGQVVKAGDLWYDTKNSPVRLKVWRGGKIMEIENRIVESP